MSDEEFHLEISKNIGCIRLDMKALCKPGAFFEIHGNPHELNSNGKAIVEINGQPVTVEPHQLRVVQEHAELSQRIDKLTAFILENPLFQAAPHEERELLEMQLTAMQKYHDILVHRMARFCKPCRT